MHRSWLLSMNLLLAAAATHADFEPERVHLLDQVGSNFLFRGPIPIVNGTYAISQVSAQLCVCDNRN